MVWELRHSSSTGCLACAEAGRRQDGIDERRPGKRFKVGGIKKDKS